MNAAGRGTRVIVWPIVLWGAGALAEDTVPLFVSASHATQQGFVRIVNHSDQAGSVTVHATDDSGSRFGPVVIAFDPWQTRHFNSDDLELGNESKGLSTGTGSGSGDWRLDIESDLPSLQILAYVRTSDGFLTSMHDLGREGSFYHVVPIFNPASNRNQRSKLRVINNDDSEVSVKIVGVDDGGMQAPEVRFSLGPAEALAVTSEQLESGHPDLEGQFGDGAGKWQLYIAADGPVAVMGLLESATGHLTNLSTSNTTEDYAPPNGTIDGGEGFTLDPRNEDSTAIVFANGRFFVLDYVYPKVYAYTSVGGRDLDRDFELVADSYSYAEGIAVAEGRFYVVHPDHVYVFGRDGTRQGLREFTLRNENPQGVVYADGVLYVLDDDGDVVGDAKVYAYELAGTRAEDRDFDLPDVGRAESFAYGDGTFYVLDVDPGGGSTNELEVVPYTSEGEPVVNGRFGVVWPGGRDSNMGIAYVSDRLYLVAGYSGDIVVYGVDGERVAPADAEATP